ncbi:uncharacterized protein LOC120115246 [Hibiscus syriacus]|uniref:uncharacterized protein LOC120115246 n=1 Tax=Hibiscus syriacus TaxID=106335 RepID=UPI00192459D5|nr:uncharacterized protein LOC120115246 [Hibiscus syriacus]
MENETVSGETSDLRSSKPIKILKLKISKLCNQHICPFCSKEFTSGKALGGHIRIHTKGNNNNGRHRRISKLCSNPKRRISPKHSGDQEDDKIVSCCVCNKVFKSMKSLFGHMRNHPERSWRGIRPPPSEKNSCCSSVSEDGEATEVHQVSYATEENSEDEEVLEAACCLMIMAQKNSFDFDRSSFGKSSLTDKLSIDNNSCFDQFHKSPRKPVEEEGDPSAMEGFYPKNPNGHGKQFGAPVNKTTAPEMVEGVREHRYSETEDSHQVCSHKMFDFDLNEPYVPVDHEGII